MKMTKDGQYYYAPHRRQWGAWQCHYAGNGVTFGDFVKDFPTKEQARDFVYEKNGWKKKENNEAKIQETKLSTT